MTAAKANLVRVERMSGKMETNAKKRERLLSQKGRLRISSIWEEYLMVKGNNLKGILSDENRY